MMTTRLYYDDSYLTDFTAAVVDRADGGHRIYLDRTAFYPTSGGQLSDTGRLGGIEVLDVMDEDERIAHLLAAPLDGDRVEGRVDWPRRFDHMQQHTGQHLLSAVVAERFGWPTVSVHFGDDASTLDLDVESITPEQIAAVETRANEIIWEGRPIIVSFERAEDAAGLRKASTRGGTLRVVSIRDLDRSACGGTHVRTTSEIGPLLIRKVERVRKQVRLEFLCGGRALGRARADQELLARLAVTLSAAPDELPRLIEAQRAELKAGASARRDLEDELNTHRARALYDATPPDSAGIRRALVEGESGIESRRGLAQRYTALPKTILVALSTTPPAVLVAASADSGMDAGATLKGVLERVGGRGGGSPRLAQGTVPTLEALERVRRELSG